MMGLDDPMLKRIWKAFDTPDGGDMRASGLRVPNTAMWADDIARFRFRAAGSRMGNLMLSMSGVGDRPLFLSTQFGKTLGQFTSFGFAAVGRIALMRVQAKDMAALNASLMAMAMGAIIYQLKTTATGGRTSDDPMEWTVRAFDNSGLHGWLANADGLLSRATAGHVGINTLGPSDTSRVWSPLDLFEAFGGPSYGMAKGLLKAFGSITGDLADHGRVNRQAVEDARKILPSHSLFYMSWLYRMAEQAVPEGPSE